MLDFDLANMYQIPTKALKQAVKRNIERFPDDFMFQLTENEWRELVTNCDRLPSTIKHSSVLPSAFTQEGVASLSGVLKSPMAVNVYLSIMSAFVAMRNYIMQSSVIQAELAEMRNRVQLLERDCRENLEAMNDSDNNRGYTSGYGFNRINVRSNLDFQLTKTTTLKANLSPSHKVTCGYHGYPKGLPSA